MQSGLIPRDEPSVRRRIRFPTVPRALAGALLIGLGGTLALFLVCFRLVVASDRQLVDGRMNARVVLVERSAQDAMANLSLLGNVLASAARGAPAQRLRELAEPVRQRFPYLLALSLAAPAPAKAGRGGEHGARRYLIVDELARLYLAAVDQAAGAVDAAPGATVGPAAIALFAISTEAPRLAGFRLPLAPAGNDGAADMVGLISLDALCQSMLAELAPVGEAVRLSIAASRQFPGLACGAAAAGNAAAPGLPVLGQVQLGGHRLLIESAPDRRAVWRPTAFALTVLLAGLSITLLAAWLVHTHDTRHRRVRKLIALRTSGLKQSNQVLLEDMLRRATLEAELQRSRGELRQLAEHQDKVKEEERKRIARDIHDDLGQSLLALRIDLAVMDRASAAPAIRDLIVEAVGKVDAAMAKVKLIINDLRPAVLDLGLHAAVEWEVRKFQRRQGITCTLDFHDGEFALDEQRATAMFRIVQESLSNITRHARASHVHIDIRREQGWLFMTVRDNGVGMPPAGQRKPDSFGLIGIAERVYALGGAYFTESGPGEGTTITVTIPLQAGEPAGRTG